MGDAFREIAGSGSLALAIPVAMVAGLFSFFSPCVIPLLPGYLSYATGLSGADLAAGEGDRQRGRMLLGSVLFVLGFASVFVALGTISGALGEWLFEWTSVITKVLGAITIVLGLAFAGWLPFFQRDLRVHKVPAVGLAAAPMLGFLFGLGWTPCLGPTLQVIMAMAYTEGTAPRGALLAGMYSLGLGIPFIVAGLAYRRALGAFDFFKRHQVAVMRIGGLMLVVVGLLMVTGWWLDMVTWLQIHLISDFEVSV